MQIDDKMISYLEDLSYITLSDSEKNRLAADFQKILNHIARLSELNTENAPHQDTNPWIGNKVNVFRDDEVRPFIDRELILKNAPVRNEEFFIAPRTVE